MDDKEKMALLSNMRKDVKNKLGQTEDYDSNASYSQQQFSNERSEDGEVSRTPSQGCERASRAGGAGGMAWVWIRVLGTAIENAELPQKTWKPTMGCSV